MVISLKIVRRAEQQVRESHPDLAGPDFEEAVQEILHDWAASAAHDRELYGDPEDTPCLENGRDNCDDAGTGEGRWHGRF